MSTVFELPRMDRVLHGEGAAGGVADELARLGVRRPLIVASGTLATSTDAVDRLASAAGAVAVFHDVPAHVPRETVLEVGGRYRRMQADGLVSIGGGSPIDCAKAVALCISEDVDDTAGLDRHRIQYRHPGPAAVPVLHGTPPPHVAVGSTLSGGEFTSLAGVTDVDRGVKDLFLSAGLMPRVAVLDPEIARHTPAWLWMSTGVRAIDHIVEGVYSPRHTEMTDALLLGALRILAVDLVPSAATPDDLERRARCQMAAWMAIMHLKNVSPGLSHGLGHQLGARFGVPHGVTSCILLPPVMEFNRPFTADRQALIAAALGVDVAGMSVDDAAVAAVRQLRRLLTTMHVPTRLSDVGVGAEKFDELVDEALQDAAVAANPRPVSAADVRAVLEAAR